MAAEGWHVSKPPHQRAATNQPWPWRRSNCQGNHDSITRGVLHRIQYHFMGLRSCTDFPFHSLLPHAKTERVHVLRLRAVQEESMDTAKVPGTAHG